MELYSRHLRGTLQADPSEDLRGVLERLSDNMEQRLLPKNIWKIDKVSDDALAKMIRQIAPISMEVSAIDGTWKLGQNKPNEARLAAGRAVGPTGLGFEISSLGDLMLDPPN